MHSRLQITSPRAAPDLLWVTPHQLPASSSMSQSRSDRASLGPHSPLVCRQLLPCPGCREPVGDRPVCSCTLRAHTSPQTAQRGQFSTHLPSSEQTWELAAHKDHKTIPSSLKNGYYYFLITCCCDGFGAGIRRSGTSPSLNLLFHLMTEFVRDSYQQTELSVKVYQG